MELVLALVAVGGTIAGALIGLFAPTWNDERIQRRWDLREFRQAKRLVFQELLVAKARLTEMLAAVEENRPVPPGRVIETAEWDAHRSVLAALAPDKVWYRTMLAYRTLQAVREGLPERLPRADLTEKGEHLIRESLKWTTEAEEALEATQPMSDREALESR
jgi:hypothetical protein